MILSKEQQDAMHKRCDPIQPNAILWQWRAIRVQHCTAQCDFWCDILDMARQVDRFSIFVIRESRVIRDWTFKGLKNYTMDVIGVIGVIM